MKKGTILFVCKGNSGRSQMAEAFFNSIFPGGGAASAGVKPDREIHPQTIEVMKEVKIDVSQKRPKLLTDKMLQKAEHIIIMDSDVLQHMPSKYMSKAEIWPVEGLLGKSTEEVRHIRDYISVKVSKLLSSAQSDFRRY